MRPLRIKASGSPPSSGNFQGLQEQTDTEINQYLSYVITNKFATDTNGTGTAELNVDTSNALSGTSIGTFTDTIRNDSIGTHPTAGATSSTTYYFKQVTSAAAESITNRPVGWDSAVKEFTDGQLDTDILDKVIEDMVSESSYTVGQYRLAASAPTGGTWTSRYTITDTTQGGNNTTYLWQKTAPTSAANSDLASLKVDGTSSLKMMTAAEIEQLVPNFRNRIIDTSIGTYKVQETAPSPGTWVQMGDAFSDTRQEVAGVGYAGAYAGTYNTTYTGDYNTSYAGSYNTNYTGQYAGSYVGPKSYTGSYTRAYAGTYAGNYVGTGAYAGTYSNTFAQTFILYYAGYVGGYYTGYFTGYFTGYYTGAKTYTGSYTGLYNQAYSGAYVGTSAYSGTYTGVYTGQYTGSYTKAYTGAYTKAYSGSYSGSYTGNTIQASTETVSTIKLWVRTA